MMGIIVPACRNGPMYALRVGWGGVALLCCVKMVLGLNFWVGVNAMAHALSGDQLQHNKDVENSIVFPVQGPGQ
jgi:hypothetical protein